MRVIFATLSVIMGLVGLFFIIQGSRHPAKYREVLAENASAVQVTQVYTEATHQVTLGIGFVSIAVLVALIGILFCCGYQGRDPEAEGDLTEQDTTEMDDYRF